MDFGLGLGDAPGEVVAEALELGAVDSDAGALHRRDDRRQRSFDRFVEGNPMLGDQARFQQAMEPQRVIRVLGRIFAGTIERHGGKSDVVLAAAGDVLVLDHVVAEMELGQLIETMAVQSGVEHERDQHGAIDRPDGDVVAAQHLHVVFDVLTDLEHSRIFEQRLEPLD